MDKIKVNGTNKLLWYGWRTDAAKHFEVSQRTIENWFYLKDDAGPKAKMNREELKFFCQQRLKTAGLSKEAIEEKITEAFG